MKKAVELFVKAMFWLGVLEALWLLFRIFVLGV